MIVVYGDCGTGGRLDEVLARYPAVRPAGVHCFQWYAGELYQRFDDDIGIYFLTDWLVTNWDRAVIKGLGLDRFPWLEGRPTSATSRASCSCASTPIPTARRRRARSPRGWASRWRSTTSGIEPLEDAADPPDERNDGGTRRCSSMTPPRRSSPTSRRRRSTRQAMRILEEIGTDVMHEPARKLLAEAGLKVEDERVYWDRGFVMEQVAKAPSSFRLRGAQPASGRSTVGGPTACRCG